MPTTTPNLAIVPQPAPVNLMIFDLDDCLAGITNKHLRHYLNLSFMAQLSEAQIEALLGDGAEIHVPEGQTRHYALAEHLNVTGMQGVFGCSAEHAADLMGGTEAGYGRDWIEGCYKTMADGFLANIHKHLPKNPELRVQLQALIDRGWMLAILTQGRRDYAGGVLKYLGVLDLFDDQIILGRAEVDYVSKKDGMPYRILLERVSEGYGEPESIWMLEDSVANLNPTVQMGFNTALVGNQQEPPYWLDEHETDINATLATLLARADV